LSKSDLEETLAFQLKALGIPFEREVKFHPKRRWRLDFTLPNKVAIAVQGGIWKKGRHVRPLGYQNDCEKYSAAAILGWRIIFATPKTIESGEAVQWAEEASK